MPNVAVFIDDKAAERLSRLEESTSRGRAWLLRHAIDGLLVGRVAADVEAVLMGLRDVEAKRIESVPQAPALRLTRTAAMSLQGIEGIAAADERAIERDRNQALLRNLNTLAGQPSDSRVAVVVNTSERSWPTIGRRAIFRMQDGLMMVLAVSRA